MSHVISEEILDAVRVLRGRLVPATVRLRPPYDPDGQTIKC